MKVPFKIKKQSLNRNSEKDSCWGINNSLMSSIFAVETKYDSFGLQFSVSLLFETATENGAKTETNMTSAGFGIYALSLYTDRIGLYVNLDLVFPQTINMKVTYGGITQSYSVSRSDYDSL